MAMKNTGSSRATLTTLFLKHQLDKMIMLIVYVDDKIIIRDDDEEISKLQKELATELEMKNLKGLKYILELYLQTMNISLPNEVCVGSINRGKDVRVQTNRYSNCSKSQVWRILRSSIYE